MSRPKLISDDALIQIAQAHFFRDGFRASTTAIALEAGVSEATLFKRFSTKMGLFQRAMGLPQCKVMDNADERVGKGDVREQLREIAQEMLTFFEELVPRLAAFSGVPGLNPFELLSQDQAPPPLVILRALTNYLEAEMDQGRIKRSDPEVLARVVMGSLYNFAFFKHLRLFARQPMADERYVRELVDLIWMGVKPPEGGEG